MVKLFKEDNLYGVETIAQKLDVSERTVWRMIEEDKLPHTKVRSQVRVPGFGLNNYLDTRGSATYSGEAPKHMPNTSGKA